MIDLNDKSSECDSDLVLVGELLTHFIRDGTKLYLYDNRNGEKVRFMSELAKAPVTCIKFE